jgi:hypothetical protein
MAPPTVLTLKTSFLSAQTRLLAQPITPSRTWRNANDEANDSLSEKAVDDALFRLNQLLQQHSRRVHAPQATRHIAEQIDRLYWDAAEKYLEQDEDSGLQLDNLGKCPVSSQRKRFVLTLRIADSEVIEALPQVWESEREVNAHPLEAKRYSELVSRLQELNERRRHTESTVARLRQMRVLLDPFQVDEEGRGVQENLLTRDGEVEKELERMKLLLARVGGRVGHLLEQSGDTRGSSSSDLFGGDSTAIMVDDAEVEETRKVSDLSGRF